MKKLKKLGIVGWLLACAMFITSVSAAQEDTPDSPNAKEARRLMEEGAAAVGKGDLYAAREAFMKSLELYRSYDVACNLGIVEFELKRYLDAAESLDLCLRTFATGENRQLLETVKGKWKETMAYVGAAEISVSSAGAEISVDGEPVGTSPLDHRVFLMAGEHTVRAEGSAGVAEETFTAEKTKTVEVSLELEPEVASGLDSEVGTTPPPSAEPFGDEPERARRNWVPAYILGGVTVAALGTSMVFRGLAGGKKNEIDDLQPTDPSECTSGGSAACEELTSAVEARDAFIDVSNVSLIVSGAAAAVTIGYVAYVLTKKKSPGRVNASFGFDGKGGALLVGGQF